MASREDGSADVQVEALDDLIARASQEEPVQPPVWRTVNPTPELLNRLERLAADDNDDINSLSRFAVGALSQAPGHEPVARLQALAERQPQRWGLARIAEQAACRRATDLALERLPPDVVAAAHEFVTRFGR